MFDTTLRTTHAQPLPLEGERVAFTGTLASMTHKEAQARVAACGGTATDHVSRQTTMLVVGEEGWPLEADGQPSVKLTQVEQWRQAGLEIRIVKESEWLAFVGLDAEHRDMRRLYTPAMLSQMLSISVHEVRRWERRGLIRPVSRVHRLPYFDLQEAAGARRLSELIAAGVAIEEIQQSLARLRTVWSDVDRPLAQLEILAQDRRLVYRDTHGRLKTAAGQMLFDFEEPVRDRAPAEELSTIRFPVTDEESLTAADWSARARELSDQGNLAGAAEACRMALMLDHDLPEVHFQLAETLYRQDNLRGASERYHVAVELDPQYVEAWTQLGCLHAQLGELESAVDAFRVALDVHADYPDAHLHLAESLHQLGRTTEALGHWRKYLEFDSRGPWAESARRRLEAAAPAYADPDITSP